MSMDPKMQAFLEDIAVVCIKHRMGIYGQENVRFSELRPEDCFAYVTSEGEILFDDEDPSPWWQSDGLTMIFEFAAASTLAEGATS